MDASRLPGGAMHHVEDIGKLLLQETSDVSHF